MLLPRSCRSTARQAVQMGSTTRRSPARARTRSAARRATAARRAFASDALRARSGRRRCAAGTRGYGNGMRVVVIGATGNVGTSVLESLEAESAVHDVVAVARRAPSRAFARTTFVAADVASFDLVPLLRGADAVVHLAWLIQPGRSESITHSVNVAGSERFRAALEAKVPTIVYASSVGAYSPDPRTDSLTSRGRLAGSGARSIPGTRSRSSGRSITSNASNRSSAWCGCGPH